MQRREFITLLGGAAAWPLVARAQQPGRLPTIGFLGSDATAWSQRTAAFVQRLRDLGWIDGRTVAIEYRWSEGRPERVADIAAALVRLKVDVIFAFSDAVPALKQATSAIPIVFALGRDPIGGGLVSSLARPGSNVTGLSSQAADTAAKRIELLRDVVPHLHRLAILADPSDLSGLETREAQTAAHALGIETELLEIRRAQDIAPAFMELKADTLYVVAGALVSANRTRIITLALGARLPSIFFDRDYVQAGGLMSYGESAVDEFRHAAELVDKILRGSKPGDIPVEQPTKFELVVNLTAAQAIRLMIPGSFLARADEVIE
jgi:putative tryptophan/tyrosine transport system substrate-binding protein